MSNYRMYTEINIKRLIEKNVKIDVYNFLSSNATVMGQFPKHCLAWQGYRSVNIAILEYANNIVHEFGFIPEVIFVEGHGWKNTIIHSDIINYFKRRYPNRTIIKVKLYHKNCYLRV